MSGNFQQVQLIKEKPIKAKFTVLQWRTLIDAMQRVAVQEIKDQNDLYQCYRYAVASIVIKAKNALARNWRNMKEVTVNINTSEYHAMRCFVQQIENKKLQAYAHAIIYQLEQRK